MKLIRTATISLILSGALFAQDQRATLDVTSQNEKPVIDIQNNYGQPMEAYLISVERVGTHKTLTRIYFDVHSNPKIDTPVLPGDSKQIPLPRIVEEPLPTATLRAAIFSDGSTFGDDHWVTELLHRRKVLIDRLQEALILFGKISSQHLGRKDAIEVIEEAYRARSADNSTSREERSWNEQIFLITSKSLNGEAFVNGKPADVHQAIGLLTRFYNEWLTDLQSAKPSIP